MRLAMISTHARTSAVCHCHVVEHRTQRPGARVAQENIEENREGRIGTSDAHSSSLQKNAVMKNIYLVSALSLLVPAAAFAQP